MIHNGSAVVDRDKSEKIAGSEVVPVIIIIIILFNVLFQSETM